MAIYDARILELCSSGYYWCPAPGRGRRNGLPVDAGYWDLSAAGTAITGLLGRHIGYYGGINYGYGYVGVGYQGGYWNGDRFDYNRSVNNVNITNVQVYNRTVRIQSCQQHHRHIRITVPASRPGGINRGLCRRKRPQYVSSAFLR